MQDTLDAYKEGYNKSNETTLEFIFQATGLRFCSTADLIIELRRFQNRIDMLEQTVVLLKQNIEA
jgi:hypothetical protein